jgi:hypothetical protein
MSVTFALSLSSQGIDLLERVPAGWALLGSAQVQADDLPAQLAKMRQIAWLLAPQGFATKLVLPADQIKYLTLEGEISSLYDIQRALENQTPYAMRDLVVDFSHAAGRTYVAAVAKDTLQEAEDFARAYGFNPVSFVARPAPMTTMQEMVFGPTLMAKKAGSAQAVAPDPCPVPLIEAARRATQRSFAGYRKRIDPVIAAYDPQAAPTRAALVQDVALRPSHTAKVQQVVTQISAASAPILDTTIQAARDIGRAKLVPAGKVLAAQMMRSPRAVAAAGGVIVASLVMAVTITLWPAGAPAPQQAAVATPAPAPIEIPEIIAQTPPDIAPVIWQDPPRLDAVQTVTASAIPQWPALTDLPRQTPAPLTEFARLAASALPIVDAAPVVALAAPLVPTTEGVRGRDGIMIFAGLPDLVLPPRPVRPAAVAQDAPDAPTAGGVALTSLQAGSVAVLTPPEGALRPRARPERPAPASVNSDAITAVLGGIALAAPDPFAGATPRAVAQSIRPPQRPRNFDRVVATARSRQQAPATPAPPQAAPEPASVAAAPAVARAIAPVPGGVARAATQDGAMPLRQINLIGVYGTQNARRALVRLSNGQFVRVEVGSDLDGGQVTAIGDTALNYVKRGQTFALQLP